MTVIYETIHNTSEDGRGSNSTLGYFDTLDEAVIAAVGANGYGSDGTVNRIDTSEPTSRTTPVYGYVSATDPWHAEWSRPNRGSDFIWKNLGDDELNIAKTQRMMNRVLVKSEKYTEVAEEISVLQSQAEALGYKVVRVR